MEERRRQLRRKADRELHDELLRARVNEADSKDLKRQRRHAIRHACHAQLELELAMGQPGTGNWKVSRTRVKGRVLDLSETGASLFLQHAVAVGQDFRLIIKLSDGTVIEALADTRWSKSVPAKGGYAIGAQFKHLAPNHGQAIRRFLAELEANVGL